MPVTDRNFRWPTKDDYDYAMHNMQETVLDADIRDGKLAASGVRIRHLGGAITTSLYHIQDPQNRNWIVRCFCEAGTATAFDGSMQRTSPPEDILRRYEKITDFCNTHLEEVPALLPVTYVKEAIKVKYFERDFTGRPLSILKTEVLPFIRMPFAEGISLGRFIARQCSSYNDLYNKNALRLLADSWVEMIRSLEKAHIAHGDLDLTNVKVVQEQPDSPPVLRLIDYDNLWIPDLAGYPQTEKGHEAFQHPYYFWMVDERPFNAEMDRFSALVIYISIRILAAHPEMYEKAGADESNRLLFTSRDYQNEQATTSSCIQEFLDLNIPGLKPYLEALRNSLRNKCMPPSLDEIGEGVVGLTPPPPMPPLRIEDPEPIAPAIQGREEENEPIKIREVGWVDWSQASFRGDVDGPLIKDSPPYPAARTPRNWPPRPPVQQPQEAKRLPPDPEQTERPARPAQAPQPVQREQRQTPAPRPVPFEPQPAHFEQPQAPTPKPAHFEQPLAPAPQSSEASDGQKEWERPSWQPQPARFGQQSMAPQFEQPPVVRESPGIERQPLAQQPPQFEQPPTVGQSPWGEPESAIRQSQRSEPQPTQLPGTPPKQEQLYLGEARRSDHLPSAERTEPVGRNYGYNSYGFEDGVRENQPASSLNPRIVGCIVVALVLLIIAFVVFYLLLHASTASAPHSLHIVPTRLLLQVPFSALSFEKIV